MLTVKNIQKQTQKTKQLKHEIKNKWPAEIHY